MFNFENVPVGYFYPECFFFQPIFAFFQPGFIFERTGTKLLNQLKAYSFIIEKEEQCKKIYLSDQNGAIGEQRLLGLNLGYWENQDGRLTGLYHFGLKQYLPLEKDSWLRTNQTYVSYCRWYLRGYCFFQHSMLLGGVGLPTSKDFGVLPYIEKLKIFHEFIRTNFYPPVSQSWFNGGLTPERYKVFLSYLEDIAWDPIIVFGIRIAEWNVSVDYTSTTYKQIRPTLKVEAIILGGGSRQVYYTNPITTGNPKNVN